MKNLRERLSSLINSPSYQPLNKSEIARALSVKPNERASLRAEILRLESKGVVTRGKKGRFTLRAKSAEKGSTNFKEKRGTSIREGERRGRSSGTGALLHGVLRFQTSGHAWFYPDTNDEANLATGMDLKKFSRIFINSTKTSTAMNGDKVAVRVDRIGQPDWTKNRRGKNQEAAGMAKPADEAAGYVEKIISRGMARIIGTYFRSGKFAHVQPDDMKIPDVNIERASLPANKDDGPKPGQVVAVELTQWDNPNSKPLGRVTEVLGWPDTPGIDMLAIVHKLGLRDEFPGEVLHEAKRFGDHVTEKDVIDRDDWRDRIVMTIDPHDAKDFDDAISVKKIESGWELAVHIADVSHYVKPGSALDHEARERGNSTYMADRVLPMIPRELSNHLCSLMPDVERLTQCCLMKINKQGVVRSAQFTRAVIHSAKRFTYEEAQDILMDVEGTKGDPINDMLHESWRLASMIRKLRFANGALDLEMPEVSVTLDDTGKPTGIEKSIYNESHQLIEEFMLLANESAASILRKRQQATIYRVHEDPDPDRLNDFAEQAKQHGYQPGDLTNKKHIQALLDAAKGSIEEPAIKIGLLKSLKRAAYFQDPLGHYGLSKDNYCHFTSPIRRYADLIVHRSLQHIQSNPPAQKDRVPKQGEIEQIALHISETERTSAEAENLSRRLKMLQYLHMCTLMKDPPKFTILVTDIRHFGLFVEAIDIMTKGLIKVEDFPEDRGSSDWTFEANLIRFVGPYGNTFAPGQQYKCHVARVDMDRQMVDFKFAEPPFPKE
ncbi:MAG: ribonuclease R family protein [Akkermansiaceae bacterium]